MAHGGAVAGFVLAAHTCGDPTGERALCALAPALRGPLEAALTEIASEDQNGRRRRLSTASQALDPDPPEAAFLRVRRPSRPEPRGLERALRRIAEPDPEAAELALVAANAPVAEAACNG